LAAIFLGLAIGGLMVGVAAFFTPKPARVEPARFLGLARIWGSRAIGRPCPGALGELLVTSDEMGVHHFPVVLTDSGRTGLCVVAAYSDGGVPTRMVTFFIQEPHVYVQTGMHTDCGDFAGAVEAHSSTVHLHGDRLCFDLSVDLLNGGPTHERWAGQLKLE
jgi:hypothetical protein